ncbi:hypothetical protein KUTeg_011588 [Tegillarca granosa]|uniref:Uncharacterized protein n=1 Tax=Tegillarca granosa TaxID=220873 RepID=A0ABQ9EX52_TEGGR|nr:hypothetical protein KUTeg_011588 [Tegillarca granosa]
MSNLPDVESCDIMLYLLKCCGINLYKENYTGQEQNVFTMWSDTKLHRYKTDDGYQLHLENHVDEINLHSSI